MKYKAKADRYKTSSLARSNPNVEEKLSTSEICKWLSSCAQERHKTDFSFLFFFSLSEVFFRSIPHNWKFEEVSNQEGEEKYTRNGWSFFCSISLLLFFCSLSVIWFAIMGCVDAFQRIVFVFKKTNTHYKVHCSDKIISLTLLRNAC